MTQFDPDTNLFLAGFMGSGKTTAGRGLARALGRPFVDSDARIEAQTGRSISEIFESDGEPAFRLLEAEVCAQIAQGNGQVVALGGGALLNEETRLALRAVGIIICLRASPDSVWRRLAARSDRPLLSETPGEHDRGRLLSLFAQRSAHYASFDLQVSTDDADPEEVVARLLAVVETLK